MLLLAYFYEIQMPFSKSASKTLSLIQSTAKYIFVQAPYSTCCEEVFFFPMWNMLFGSRFIIFREGMWTKPISYQTDPSLSKMTWFESRKKNIQANNDVLQEGKDWIWKENWTQKKDCKLSVAKWPEFPLKRKYPISIWKSKEI